jgi:predicted lipoprotein with Yx(FWY)xxD motif
MVRGVLSSIAWAALIASAAPAAAQQAVTLKASQSQEHGAYVTDAEGRSVYLFEADAQGQGEAKAESTCRDACAEAWPPLLSEGEPQAGEGLDAALIATIDRGDGQMQVTYNGWPLYYYVKDQNPGDATGHDIEDFGAEWYLVTPEDGKAED